MFYYNLISSITNRIRPRKKLLDSTVALMYAARNFRMLVTARLTIRHPRRRGWDGTNDWPTGAYTGVLGL